jgi:hypothetical protein
VLTLLLEVHERTGVWLGRDELASRLDLSPQAVTAHRRRLINSGELPAEAAAARRGTRRPHFGITVVDPKRRITESVVPEAGVFIDMIGVLTDGESDCVLVAISDDMDIPAAEVPRHSWVVVHPQPTARTGAYVLTRTVDQRTGDARISIKKMSTRKTGAKATAQPKRAARNTPLVPGEEILGVVVSVVRDLSLRRRSRY